MNMIIPFHADQFAEINSQTHRQQAADIANRIVNQCGFTIFCNRSEQHGMITIGNTGHDPETRSHVGLLIGLEPIVKPEPECDHEIEYIAGATQRTSPMMVRTVYKVSSGVCPKFSQEIA